jgi:two-component system response regulator DesR
MTALPLRSGPLRLLIADSDRHVRSSLTGLIGLGSEVEVTATSDAGPSVRVLVEELSPGVVVVDVRECAPEIGLELVSLLCQMPRGPTVVAMSTCAALEGPARAAGAVAFLVKDGDPGQFLGAILAAAGRPGTEAAA